MRKNHSGWARKLKIIEWCINETHHDTIGITPYEAQFGQRPARSWTKLINKDVIPDGPVSDRSEIHLRIKEKRQKAEDKVNSSTKIK